MAELLQTRSTTSGYSIAINAVKEGARTKDSSLSKTVGNTIGRNNLYYKNMDRAQAKFSDSEYHSYVTIMRIIRTKQTVHTMNQSKQL